MHENLLHQEWNCTYKLLFFFFCAAFCTNKCLDNDVKWHGLNNWLLNSSLNYLTTFSRQKKWSHNLSPGSSFCRQCGRQVGGSWSICLVRETDHWSWWKMRVFSHPLLGVSFFFPMAIFFLVEQLQFGDLNVELVIGKTWIMVSRMASRYWGTAKYSISVWYQYMVCLKKYVSRPVSFAPVSVRQWCHFATWKTPWLRKACLGRFFAQQLQWKGIYSWQSK